MMKKIFAMLLALMLSVGLVSVANAADASATAIYVSESGSDTGDGSRDNPYATLQAAFDATINGGDYEIILLTDITASDAVDQYNSAYRRNEALKYKAPANVTLRSDNASNPYTIYRDCEEYVIRVAGKDQSNPLTFTLKDIVFDGNAKKYTSDHKIYSLFLINYTNMYIESGTILRNNVNTSPTGQGGAVNVQTASSLVMNDGIIEYCKAYSGGALYSPSTGIPITINGGIFRYNEATADAVTSHETNANGGGAIFTCGELTITGGTFTNNKAVRGGAILSRNLYGTNIISSNVIIENNTATKHGGAIHSAGNFTISGGTIQNNHADGRAGGVFHSSGNGKLTLVGGTVSGNTESANKASSGVVDYRNYNRNSDTLSNTSSGGYISSYVFTMVYMSNNFACTDTIYTNRPLRITAWDSSLNNSYKIEPLETSTSLTVSSTYGSKLPLGNFVVFGDSESIQPELNKFSSDGYTLIQKDTLERFIFYGTPHTSPIISLTADNENLSYEITPVATESSAVSGYEIQLYLPDGTTKVGEPIPVVELTGTIEIAAGSYRASVRAIDTKKNSSGYIVKDITKYCESDWSALSESVTIENPTYTVSASANPTEGGTVSGAGEYEADKTVTLTATASTGYTFINWTENGTEVSNNTSYTFTVNSDCTLVANFEKIHTHTYGNAEFTWTADGTSATAAITCSGCDDDAEGHTLSGTATVEKTSSTTGDCKTEGTTTYEARIMLNGQEYTDTKTVEGALGDHAYGELIAEQLEKHTQTELKAGVAAHYYCGVCGKYFTEGKVETTLEALTGYEPTHNDSAWVNTNAEHHWKKCSVCGLGYTDAKAEHHYADEEDTTCEDCGYERTIAHKHTFANTLSYDENNHWYAATCGHTSEVSGFEEHSGGNATCTAQAECADCGQPYGEFGDHAYGDLIAEQPEIHTQAQLKAGVAAHYICGTCGKYFTEDWTETTLERLTGSLPEHRCDTWVKTNPNVHWQLCECGLKANEGPHAFDGDKDLVCDACGYERNAPVILATLILDIDGEAESMSVPVGTRIDDLGTPQLPGHVFIGWTDTKGNPVSLPMTVGEGTTVLVARFEPIPALPQTGDDSRFALWALLLGLSGAALIAAKKRAYH